MRVDRPTDLGLLCAVTASLARLDERLSGSLPAIRDGWVERALLQEAAASVRLEDTRVDGRDLLLFEHDLLPRLADHDMHSAHRALLLLRAAGRRDARQLFTPRRLMAAARLKLRDRAGEAIGSRWLQERLQDSLAEPEEIRASLSRALDPLALQTFRLAPPALGAAGFLARWHATGAATLVGGVAGRALTAAWMRRCGLVRRPVALPAIGFLGHAAEYGLMAGDGWNDIVLAALQRGAEWGLALHDRLIRADRRLREGAPARRSSSHLPAVIDLLLARPGVTIKGLAQELRISTTAVRALLRPLEDKQLLQELTGNGSFRLFSAI